MLVARIAVNNPDAAAQRQLHLEAHKTHLRSAPFPLLGSGPVHDGQGRQIGAIILAEVEQFETFERFSAADPFVMNEVYVTPKIIEWRPTLGALIATEGWHSDISRT